MPWRFALSTTKRGGFYQKYGFEPLTDDPLHLYLSMKVVRKLNLSG